MLRHHFAIQYIKQMPSFLALCHTNVI